MVLKRKRQKKVQLKTKTSRHKLQRINLNKLKPTKIEEHHVPHLAQVHTLEEFFFALQLLDEQKSILLIDHYKQTIHAHQDREILERVLQKNKLLPQIKEALKQVMIGKLNEDYKSLQQKIEKEKKRGVDTLIDELKLEQVPFKIKMFSLSGTKDDYYVVKRLLALIK